MYGPFPLSQIDKIPISPFPGVYILSRDGEDIPDKDKRAHYVGRSDVDIGARLKQHAQSSQVYQYFWFEYVTSPHQAYQLECQLYHHFNPPDNVIHPAVPPETNWRCPVKGCVWSKDL